MGKQLKDRHVIFFTYLLGTLLFLNDLKIQGAVRPDSRRDTSILIPPFHLSYIAFDQKEVLFTAWPANDSAPSSVISSSILSFFPPILSFSFSDSRLPGRFSPLRARRNSRYSLEEVASLVLARRILPMPISPELALDDRIQASSPTKKTAMLRAESC